VVQEQIIVDPEYNLLDCIVCKNSLMDTVYERPDYTLSTQSHKLKFDLRYQLCRQCGLVFMNPQLSQACWDAYIHSATFTVMNRQVELANCAKKFKPVEKTFLDAYLKPGMQALEVGCGDGLLLYFLRYHYGCETLGIDLSEIYCHYAGDVLQLQAEHISIENFSAPDGSYDLIVSKHVFEHLCHPLNALRKVRNLLKDDGVFILEVPSVDAPQDSLRDMFAAHNFLFSPVTIRNALARTGFRIETCLEGSELFYILRKGPAEERCESDYLRVSVFLEKAVKNYQTIYQEVAQRVETLLQHWRETSAKVAIFGSGEHTFSLFSEFDFSGCNIQFLLDSNHNLCGTQRYGYPVIHPDELAGRSIDDVLISSHAYQNEMAVQLAALDCSANIHKLYTDAGE